MWFLVILSACGGAPEPAPSGPTLTCDPPTGVFVAHPGRLEQALRGLQPELDACFAAVAQETGTTETDVAFSLTAEDGQRGVGGSIMVRSDAFDDCVRDIRDTLSKTVLVDILGPLAEQQGVPKSEVGCVVSFGQPAR